MQNTHKQWAGTTGGGNFGHSFLLFLLRHTNVKVGYFFMGFSIPIYLCIHPKERNEIYSYFRNRHHFGTMKSILYTIKNHYVFGKIIIDRFAVLAKGYSPFHFETEDPQYIPQFIKQSSGFLLVGAHIGNFELAGYTHAQQEKRLYTLYYAGENAGLQSHRNDQMANNNVTMVPVSNDLSHLFTINAALENGDIVSLTGDRVFGSDKHHDCDFLGAKAPFPIGAFRMAALKNAPIVALFVMKESANKYKVIEKNITAPPIENETSVKTAVRLAQAYANSVEEILHRYPEQWFNYFPFWKEQN
ncbi:MAG: lysophospholipid acyltransferase family protein [Bacteroidales bacterium]|nr:lysophospholipid acyltransferase family protein [Bacteroidales bacterium]